MAAYPSYNDYLETADEPGPTRKPRRAKRTAPSVPMPSSPQTSVPILPGPYNSDTGQPSSGTSQFPEPHYGQNTDVTAAGGPPVPNFPTPPRGEIRVGYPTEGLNRTGKKLTEIAAQRDFDPASRIHNTDWGAEVEPPERSPSRFRQALMGALQGALAGAERTGTIGGLLGGAGTGAAAGGINPRLVLALRRDQDIRRAQGQLSDDLSLEGQSATVDYQRARPYLEASEIQRKLEHDEDVLKQQRDAETGRMTREQMQDKRAELDRQSREKVAHIRAGGGAGGTDAQAAAAEEGRIAAEEAGRSAEEIKAEMDSLRGEAISGRQSITQKEAIWKTEAARRYKAALADYVQGVDAKPELKDFYEQVKAEDQHFQAGTYDETVKNTEAKERRLTELEEEMRNVKKEGRQGRAQAGRSAGARNRGTPTKSTHAFSLSAYKKANPNATDDEARAYAEKNYPGYEVVP